MLKAMGSPPLTKTVAETPLRPPIDYSGQGNKASLVVIASPLGGISGAGARVVHVPQSGQPTVRPPWHHIPEFLLRLAINLGVGGKGAPVPRCYSELDQKCARTNIITYPVAWNNDVLKAIPWIGLRVGVSVRRK